MSADLLLAPEYVGERRGLILDWSARGQPVEVYVNDRLAGAVWRPPFELEITGFVRAGSNSVRLVTGKSGEEGSRFPMTVRSFERTRLDVWR